jgi:hypothetical protein
MAGVTAGADNREPHTGITQPLHAKDVNAVPIPWRCTSGSTASISISPVRSSAWMRTAT